MCAVATRNSALRCGLAFGVRSFLQNGVVAGLMVAVTAGAQRTYSTAQRRLDLSAFGMVSGVYTGLGGSPYDNGGVEGPEGRNVSITAGADLGFYSFLGLRLGAEVRGEAAIKAGQVDSQKSILGGLRVTHEPSGYGLFGNVRPYVDVLAGRGNIIYQNNGYPVPGILYLSNPSAVYAGGGGFEYDFSRAFSFKADALVERWNTPVVESGKIYSKQGSVGIVYRYGTGRGPR